MARNNWHLPWEQYVETLKPHERPMMPGSPATPTPARWMDMIAESGTWTAYVRLEHHFR